MEKITKYAYWMLIISYSFILIINANLSIIDDHHLIDTILKGGKLQFHIVPESARFYPLNGQEYNLMSLLSTNISWFYTFNAIELLIIAWIFPRIVKLANPQNTNLVSYIIVICIIFSPGFITSWTRLQVPERNVLVLYSIFVYNYLIFTNKQNYLNFIFAIISATIALFYKETAFIFPISIGIMGLIFDKINRKKFLFYILLIIISISWIIIYLIFYFSSQPIIRYGESQSTYFFIVPLTIIFFIMTEPFLMLILTVKMFNKLKYKNLLNEKNKNEDILIISAIIFILSYLILKIYSYHYLLPVVCVLPYVLGKFNNIKNLSKINIFVLITACIIYFVFTFPTSINILYKNKIIPQNFELTRIALSKIIKKYDNNQIFLLGINERASPEISYSLNKFIQNDIQRVVHIKTKIVKQDSNNCIFYSDLIDKNCDLIELYLKKGDIILLTPYDNVNVKEKVNDLNKFTLIYKTDALNFQLPTIKLLIENFLIKNDLFFGKKKNDIIADKVNFYIYIKN